MVTEALLRSWNTVTRSRSLSLTRSLSLSHALSLYLYLSHSRTLSLTPSLTHTLSEQDMLEAINKVIKGYAKFSATPKYMVYN